MTTCRDCERPRPHRGRGLCGSCYNRRWRHGNLDGAQPKRTAPPGPPRDPTEHGTLKGWYQHQQWGTPFCDPCRAAKRAEAKAWRDRNLDYARRRDREWKRTRRLQQKEGRITAPSVIFDVLETVGTSMGARSLITWVQELHPEWAEETVRRTLHRLVADGRVERVEFGNEIRYRLP